MQVTSLYVRDYKLLKEFNIAFRKDISILIGINGSGKSTILECIAQIFSDAVQKEKAKFGFRIEYELRMEEILEQTSTSGTFSTDFIKVELSAHDKGQQIVFKVFSDNRIFEKDTDIVKRFKSIERILPSNVVIYYSGLADIMKEICRPHDERLSANYRKLNTKAHRPFFYFEPALFEIILLTLLSYEFGDIPDFLYKRAKIKSVRSIEILLERPEWGKANIEEWWGAKGEIKNLLDYMDSIGTALLPGEKEKTNKSRGNVIIQGLQNDTILIHILGQEKLFEIREHFTEEKELFKVLNTLIIDGFSPKIKFHFAIDDSQYGSFSVLSEGEQQAIIVRGLVELVNNENTLFLFDEPDTYLHPAWQRSFIEDISNLTSVGELNTSQFLITTHSPQLLSNANPDSCDVQIIEDGEIVRVTPKYYGRDISTILYEMMGVERRNKKVAKALSILFNLIEDEELEQSKTEYAKLVELLGEDDPAMVRAKVQLDYLEEDETNS